MNPIGFYFQLRRRYAYWNTFRAYQLIDWAGDQGKAHDAELALFEAFFTRRKNVSDTRVLRRHLVTGAQGEAKYARILRRLEAAQAGTTPLKLYATWYCPCVQRAWMALLYKGLDFEYIQVDPHRKSRWWPRVSRNRAKVPVIVNRAVWDTASTEPSWGWMISNFGMNSLGS